MAAQAANTPDPRSIGLPEEARALLFDLDGVLTKTAVVHAAAWKQMFDAFLAGQTPSQPPFDSAADYNRYVDGKPRYDGVRSFLASRGISLPEGSKDDPPDAQTVCGLGNRKNELVKRLIQTEGVEAYPGSVEYVKAAERAGMRRAVVSSSENCRPILESCGLIEDFEVIIDGVVSADRGLKGKPAPDTFLAGADGLGVPREAAVVFEDALAGVEAGRAGRFGYVVGVDRVDHAAALKEHGADTVVQDLAELIAR